MTKVLLLFFLFTAAENEWMNYLCFREIPE